LLYIRPGHLSIPVIYVLCYCVIGEQMWIFLY